MAIMKSLRFDNDHFDTDHFWFGHFPPVHFSQRPISICFPMKLMIFLDDVYDDLVTFHNGNGKARNFRNYAAFVHRLTLDYIESCKNSNNWKGRVDGLIRKWDKQINLARAQLWEIFLNFDDVMKMTHQTAITRKNRKLQLSSKRILIEK